MTIIMYACFINMDNNMELGMTKTLKSEIGHLKSLENIVETGASDSEKLEIITASLGILSCLSSVWEFRSNILEKVMFFIEKMSSKFEKFHIENIGDKVLVCLTLILISKFIPILGSQKS